MENVGLNVDVDQLKSSLKGRDIENVGVDDLSASELLRSVEATSSLSYVTRRKNKKSNKNVVDAEHVEKTIGSFGAELNTNTTNHGINVEPIPHVSSSSHDSGVESSLKSKHDLIDTLFGVSIKNLVDLDAFLKGLEAGNYPMWDTLDDDVVRMAQVALSGLYDAFKAEYQAAPESNATYSDGNGNGTAPNVNVEVAEPVCEGVNVSIPRRVVEKVSARLEHTLYGYFIGNRMAFPVVDYYAKTNWAKYGLKKIMMNANGFFFFNFDTKAGLEAVLEAGPWMIRKSPIILKKWSIDTILCKEELTRIPIWVKLHDVPLQVFEDDGINLIASFIGKPIMMDSYTSSMCKDSWGRSSFARCLIEVGSEDELVEAISVGVPSLTGDGFSKVSIRVEYEWRPPRCTTCKIFGHTYETCSNNVITPPVATTVNVDKTATMPSNDGFQKVSRKKKKGKAKSGSGGQVGTSVKQTIRYEPKKTTSEPKKGVSSNVPTPSSTLKSKGPEVSTSNHFDALATVDDGDEECVENRFNESANLFSDVDKGGSSSFTHVAG